MFGKIKPGLPPIDVDIDDPDFCTGSNHDNLVVLWKELQARLNKFKELFVNDYLAMIRDRCRHHNQSGTVLPRSPRLGEVVTIYEENYDPIYWKLGKVIQVTRSQDDRCRTAKVVTANGNVLNRPINHLYSLEVDDESMKDLTSAVKANNLKKLYLQDPSAFKHTQGQEPPGVEKERSVPQNSHPMTTRKASRTSAVSSVFSLSPLLLLICCLISCLSLGSAERCLKDISWETVYKSACLDKRYSVHKTHDGYCWRQNNCSRLNLNNLKSNSLCEVNGSCSCPFWSFGCSEGFTNISHGNSTKMHPKVKQTLTLLKPLFCSYEDSKHCAATPTHKELNQVQLLDDSLHFVETLHLVHQQVHNDSFKCFGDGKHGFAGPPEYCNNHDCYESSNSVCVPTFNEKHFLRTPQGNIEIKAWGTVPRLVYLSKPLLPVTLKTTCSKGKLTVQGFQANDLLQVDYFKSSEILKAQDIIVVLTLPRSLLMIDQNVTVTCWRKGVISGSKTQLCLGENFCDHILCIFCPEFVANFACISLIWWFFLIFCIPITVLALIELIYFMYKKKRGKRAALLRQLISFISNIRQCKAQIPEEVELTELQPLSNNEPDDLPETPSRDSRQAVPITYNSAIAISIISLCFCFSMADSATQVISYQAENRFCVRTVEGITRCEHNHVAHFTVKDKNLVEMIFQDEKSAPQATLTLKITPIATCIKGRSTFTRLVTIKEYSSQRCPGSGSCIDKICEETVANTSIPELTLVNDKPGVTRCASSCACWGCGCFICTESCTFYRYFAEPQDSLIYEEFFCRHWKFGADIELIQRTNHKTESFQFHLEEGMSEEYDHLKISLTAVRSSDIISFQSFLYDGTRLSLSDDASKEAMQLLKCSSAFDAQMMNCKLDEKTCNCSPAGDGVNCQCKNNQIIKDQLDVSFFPSESAQVKLNESRVFYILEDSVSDILVETKNFEVVTQIDYNSCHFLNSSVRGCANCNNGAFVFLQCQSDFGMSLATVTCDTFVFSVLCDANTHIVTLDLNSTTVFLNCILKCPANSESFNITGELHFVNDKSVSPEKKNATSQLSWYQAITSLFDNLLNCKTYLVIALVGILLIIVILK